jgi:raw score 9.28
MNCWTFDRRDPIGKYVLTVKIGKYEFEKQVFYVTE